MQLWHAIALGTLETDDHNTIPVQISRLKGCLEFVLVVEHNGRRFNFTVLRGNGRDLDNAPTKVAIKHPQPTIGCKRLGNRAEHIRAKAFFRRGLPHQLLIRQLRHLGIALKAIANHCVHIVMQVSAAQQLPDQERRSASLVESIHVFLPVRVDPGHGRNHGGKLGVVVPVDDDPRRPGNRYPVNGVIGGTASNQQRHQSIDDALFIHHIAQTQLATVRLGQPDHLLGRRPGKLITERRIGVHKRRPRHMQAHDFHQQLVAVGGAVKRTGAGAVIGLALGLQQFFLANLALGVKLADPLLFLVREP